MIIKAWAASVGCTTFREAEKSKVLLAKNINRMTVESRFDCYAALLQCQTRNLKLKNQFFVVDWSVVLNVSKKVEILNFNLFSNFY